MLHSSLYFTKKPKLSAIEILSVLDYKRAAIQFVVIAVHWETFVRQSLTALTVTAATAFVGRLVLASFVPQILNAAIQATIVVMMNAKLTTVAVSLVVLTPNVAENCTVVGMENAMIIVLAIVVHLIQTVVMRTNTAAVTNVKKVDVPVWLPGLSF